MNAITKLFHISDVLSITTGHLVSTRHVEGVYEILNFMTGDDLFTHQLPRASRDCQPQLRRDYPELFPDDPKTKSLLVKLVLRLNTFGMDRQKAVHTFVRDVQWAHRLPDMLPISRLDPAEHRYINPIQEAVQMIGSDRVVNATDVLSNADRPNPAIPTPQSSSRRLA